MKTYQTAELAPYGLYLSFKPFDLSFVGAEGEALEGQPQAKYSRIPTPMLIVLSPVIGGVFVIAFPILVLVAIAAALVNPFGRRVRAAFDSGE